MKLFIELKGENSKDQILHFKKFLENQKIDGLESLEINRETAKEGEMGGGVFSLINFS